MSFSKVPNIGLNEPGYSVPDGTISFLFSDLRNTYMLVTVRCIIIFSQKDRDIIQFIYSAIVKLLRTVNMVLFRKDRTYVSRYYYLFNMFYG